MTHVDLQEIYIIPVLRNNEKSDQSHVGRQNQSCKQPALPLLLFPLSLNDGSLKSTKCKNGKGGEM